MATLSRCKRSDMHSAGLILLTLLLGLSAWFEGVSLSAYTFPTVSTRLLARSDSGSSTSRLKPGPLRRNMLVSRTSRPTVTCSADRVGDGDLSSESIKPMRILLIVEPTPFNYISGYANRFQETLRAFRKLTDDVFTIFTPDRSLSTAPKDFMGYAIETVRGFELYWYNHVTLTLDIKGKIRDLISAHNPDLIHVTMPSVVVFPSLFWAKLFNKPVVISYHTDLLGYARTYANFPGAHVLAKLLVKLPLLLADLILCTSPQLQQQLTDLGVKDVRVWRKGVNTEVILDYFLLEPRISPCFPKLFAPNHFNKEARKGLQFEGISDGPILLYVGRLGKEKKLDRLKPVLDAILNSTLVFVGTGPHEAELRHLFEGCRVKFMGPMTGRR
jgi:sulfoquinovosyltransferase